MMQKLYFGDMFAAYVAADNTSTRHVDVFQLHRHDSGDRVATATRDGHHVAQAALLEHIKRLSIEPRTGSACGSPGEAASEGRQ
jgi:hypothetical protein